MDEIMIAQKWSKGPIRTAQVLGFIAVTALLVSTAGSGVRAVADEVDVSGGPGEPLPGLRQTLVALTTGNQLLRFTAGAPVTALATTPISGLQPGETLFGIDVRPATGELYAIGSAGRLYTIDLNTGAAQTEAVLAADPADTTAPFAGLQGARFGLDFNPVVDRLRVVSDADQNLRIHPDTGRVTTDTPLTYDAGDSRAGQDPNIVSVAYSNNTPGSAATTLFGTAVGPDALVRIGGVEGPPSPNTGLLTTIASLDKATVVHGGFDIAPDGTGFLAVNYRTRNYGVVTIGTSQNPPPTADLGTIGNGLTPIRDIAVVPSVQFRAGLVPSHEDDGAITVTVDRTGGSIGTVTVDLETRNGTAMAGTDYTGVAQTLSFAPGELTRTVSIPITNDTAGEIDETFSVVLSRPSGGIALGGPDTTTVRISANDVRDRTGPQVVTLGLTGPSRGINGAVIRFDEDMDPARIQDPRNYQISVVPTRGPRRQIPIMAAVWDPALRAARLTVGRFAQTQFRELQVLVNGVRGGLTDTAGNLLDGDSDRRAGGTGRFLFRILHGERVTLTEPDGDQATIDVTTPDGLVFLDLIQLVGRTPLVQAWVVDPIPGITTPSGSVRRGARGNGIVVIAEIIGLDKKEFGPLFATVGLQFGTLTFSPNATGVF